MINGTKTVWSTFMNESIKLCAKFSLFIMVRCARAQSPRGDFYSNKLKKKVQSHSFFHSLTHSLSHCTQFEWSHSRESFQWIAFTRVFVVVFVRKNNFLFLSHGKINFQLKLCALVEVFNDQVTLGIGMRGFLAPTNRWLESNHAHSSLLKKKHTLTNAPDIPNQVGIFAEEKCVTIQTWNKKSISFEKVYNDCIVRSDREKKPTRIFSSCLLEKWWVYLTFVCVCEWPSFDSIWWKHVIKMFIFAFDFWKW